MFIKREVMGSQIPSSSDLSRTYWTPAMERYFIDLMLDQNHRGNRMGHTFNKQAWTDMVTMFNTNFGSQYDKDSLKSHYTNLWKQFNDIKNLLDQNGFYWDDTQQLVKADECVWNAYVKAHPDAQFYRNKALMNFNDLCLIYAYTTADGRYSRSSHDLDIDDDIPVVNTGDRMGSLVLARSERSKPEWTTAMDNYFIKLMLDQVKKGNMINNAFNKQAWTDIVALFNAKFCSQHRKRVLRHQYKKLQKYYNDMRILLEHNGFFWDRTRLMIAADDDGVWDNYIEAHPDAEFYRKRTLLNFEYLSLIYSNDIANGTCGHLCQDKDFEDDILLIMAGDDTQTPTGSDSSRTYWTVPMDSYLIDLLLDQALRGNKIGYTFITEAWIEMLTLFNAKFGSHFDKDVLKNRFKHLRRQYNGIKTLLGLSGFSYDETREMVTAEEYFWDSYTKANPDARSYRNKTLPSYHKLCVIYGQESSNGRNNNLSCNGGTEGEGPFLMIEGDIHGHADGDHSRTDWTNSMDRYLIDLMLEEVLKGASIGHTFNEQAWIGMVALFKERFGSQHDSDVLRSRHQSLFKLYLHMKTVLDQNGFLWDDMRQMVTAYDHVWDSYIKEQPDLKSFRTETKPNYNDLCIIYGSCDGARNCSDQFVKLNGTGESIRAPNSHNGLRKDWTPPMDRLFIDLLLEQIKKGTMIAYKFKEEAWSDMVAKFNATFGSRHDKDVLKDRFKKLRKQFNEMRILLDQNGFVWDEMQRMITADDDLWDSYIKEHPDAQSYRTQTLPNIDDLFLIYGNATTSQMDDYCLGVESDEEEDQSPAEGRLMCLDEEKDADLTPEMDVEIFRLLQSPVRDITITYERKKRQSTNFLASECSRKIQKTSQESTEEAKEDGSYWSIETIVDALQTVPDLDDELFIEACGLFEDEKKVEMFVALDVGKRKKWLMRKLKR